MLTPMRSLHEIESSGSRRIYMKPKMEIRATDTHSARDRVADGVRYLRLTSPFPGTRQYLGGSTILDGESDLAS